MPPAETHKKLTERQIALFKQWIEEGANFKSHWAFETPKRPAFPKTEGTAWVRNGIDHFILAKLEAQGLLVRRKGRCQQDDFGPRHGLWGRGHEQTWVPGERGLHAFRRERHAPEALAGGVRQRIADKKGAGFFRHALLRRKQMAALSRQGR